MGFAGGFTLGMVQAGLELIGKREEKPGFGVPNCEANRHLLGNNWKTQIGDEPSWDVIDAEVCAGNPPCSGWSVMANSSFRGANSPALRCTWAFVTYVTRVKPLIAVFESVQQAFTMAEGLETMRRLHAYVEEKTNEKWTLYHIRHNAYSVGGSSQRKRYFWLISRIPFGIEIPEITMYPVLNDVIGDLADLERSWDPQPYKAPAHPWAQHLLSPDGMTDGHWYVNDNPPTRRLHDLMSGTAWNPGEHIAIVARRHYEEHGKLPDSFAATEKKIVERDFSMGYTTPTRWDGNKHSRVITGGSLQLVIHPTRDRMITHREAARILGFPDNWRIAPLKNVSGLQQTWGKGITTHCGKWIGEWIKRALDGDPGTYTGHQMGEREYDIDVTHAWSRTLKNLRSPMRKLNLKDDIINPSGNTPNAHGSMHYNGRNNMSESTESMEPNTGTRRGRPRPEHTIERDDAVYAALETPMTRAQLAEATSFPKNEVYLSLYRLRAAGRIERARDGGNHVWSRVEMSDDVDTQVENSVV